MKRQEFGSTATLVAGAALGAAAAIALRPRHADAANRGSAGFNGTPSRHFYAGRSLSHAITIGDLRAMAHRRLPRFALEYLEGGAEQEATLKRNAAALARWHFRHRS